MAQKFSEVIRQRGYRSAGQAGEAAGAQGLEFGTQRRADALIGIDAQDPVVGGLLRGVLALRTVTGPFTLDDARAMGGGDGARVVRRV